MVANPAVRMHAGQGHRVHVFWCRIDFPPTPTAMPAFSTLLRMFLCVCLALNGAGYPVAGAHAHDIAGVVDAQPQAPMHHASHEMGTDAEESCHPAAQQADSGICIAMHGMVHDANTMDGDMDCCDPGNCHCPCSQHVGVVANDIVQTPIPGVTTSPAMRCVERDAPPVPRLIRPPIA